MAALFDEEGNQGTYRAAADNNDISSPRSQYSFPALKDWLSKYNLSHLESALKDEEFESLHSLIMLNASDLDELCNELKENLKQKNSKLSLKQKAIFKREIIQQQLLYNEFLSGLKSNDNNNNNQNENISQSFVVTKEERQALQTLNQMIKVLQTASSLSQNVTNNAKQLHSPIIMSISQISKQFELFLNKLFQIAYDKYMKGHNDFSIDCQKALNTLKNTKQSCYDALSMESNQQLDVVKKIDDVTKKIQQGRRDFSNQFSNEFFEKECFSALLTTLLDDINIAKMVQQFVAFFLSQLRPTINLIVQTEEICSAPPPKQEDESHNVLLLILPHAIDYVQDIENELKQRNIKIIKKLDNVNNDDAMKLLMKQWSSLIRQQYGEDEEKSFVTDSENDIFDMFKVGSLERNVQIWVFRHLTKHFKTAPNQCAAWNIELKYGGRHHWDGVHDFIGDNFDICYPSILGEYSSTFLPDTINGKLMKLWTSKQDEKQLNAKINLGFTDVISPEFVKEVLNLEISPESNPKKGRGRKAQ